MGDGPSEFQGVQRATRCRFTRIHEGKLGVAVCFHLTTLEKSKGYQVFPGRGTLAVCVAACDPKASTKSVAEATSAPPVRTTRQGVWDPPPPNPFTRSQLPPSPSGPCRHPRQACKDHKHRSSHSREELMVPLLGFSKQRFVFVLFHNEQKKTQRCLFLLSLGIRRDTLRVGGFLRTDSP